jgi:hypothetical protein
MLLRALAIWQELKTGDDWTAPTKITENFSAIKIKEIDADGKSYVIKSTHLNY